MDRNFIYRKFMMMAVAANFFCLSFCIVVDVKTPPTTATELLCQLGKACAYEALGLGLLWFLMGLRGQEPQEDQA
jgi:hypothetical protein